MSFRGCLSILTSPLLLVSAYAINLVSERLSKFSTRHRIASHATVAGAEPLTAQVAPAILLRAQQTVMEMCTSAVRFWKPMAFEPLSGSKDVTAFAVYEEGGEELNSAVKGWLHRVAEAYRVRSYHPPPLLCVYPDLLVSLQRLRGLGSTLLARLGLSRTGSQSSPLVRCRGPGSKTTFGIFVSLNFSRSSFRG